MSEIVQVKILNPDLAKALGKKKDDVVSVACRDGVPLVREWRNRFRDSKIDNCIEVVKAASKTTTKKEVKDA